MPTVKDLGRIVKARFPGEYDDLSDEEVGLRVREKYPEYDDFEDDYGFDHGSLLKPALNENVQALVKYYNPESGRLSNWWRRGKSESRAKFLVALNQEQRQLIEQAVMMENAVLQGRKNQAEFNLFLAQNAALFIKLKAEIKLTEQATNEGLIVTDYSAVNRNKYESDIKVQEYEKVTQINLKAKKEESKIQLEAKAQESKIALEAKSEESKIELQTKIEHSEYLIEATERQSLAEQNLIKRIKEELQETIRLRNKLKRQNIPQDEKDELLEIENNHIKNLRKQLNERYSRLA